MGKEIDIPYANLDDVASDGVFVMDTEPVRPFDIRKAARFAKELGIKPGEDLPKEYMDQCYF